MNANKKKTVGWILFSLLCIPLLGIIGCESLRASRPIIPIDEHERALAGRLDANYVGTDNCLKACHVHDAKRRDFEASTMGAQLSGKSGLPLVNCESCHGPGSLAIKGIKGVCDYKTLIDLKELPPPAQSLLCLKCHTANATFNLHDWNAGAHAAADVTCYNCHNVHAGPDLIVSPKDTKEMCLSCHPKQKAEFSLLSHHPVLDEKIFCTDCHNPHGTSGEKLLREPTVKETCTRCHGEYEGPYAFEHADVMEECTTCHSPHGSVNNNLLKSRQPFLCLQCHTGHRTSTDAQAMELKAVFYTRCTDCHSQIHGTDLPSASGKGRFIN